MDERDALLDLCMFVHALLFECFGSIVSFCSLTFYVLPVDVTPSLFFFFFTCNNVGFSFTSLCDARCIHLKGVLHNLFFWNEGDGSSID